MFRRTSKMSHGPLGRDSCWIRLSTRVLHSERGTIARGVTEQDVGSGALFGSLRQGEKCCRLIQLKSFNLLNPITENLCDELCRRIPSVYSNHFGRRTSQKTQVMKILILGDNRQAVFDRILPHNRVSSTGKPDIANILLFVRIAGVEWSAGEWARGSESFVSRSSV